MHPSTMPSANPDHFRNGRFFNRDAQPHGVLDLYRWMRHRQRGPWRPWISSEPGPKPPERLKGGELRVTFVNHATVLLQVGALNFVTDPMWSLRASPVQWTGPRRHRAPGIRFEDLPPIDCILLSHNHYDHMDLGTLRRLLERDHPEIFCPLGLRRPLRNIGYRTIHELDWWQHQAFRGVEVHCMPAQHFSARTPFDRDRTLWCGWLLEPAHEHKEADRGSGNVYFAGDTGFGPHFAEIATRFPAPSFAMLPIGAYRPEWFMGPVHMSPDQALEAHRILRAEQSMAIHFGTFSLADDGETEPEDRLRELLAGTEEAKRFWLLREGEGKQIADPIASNRAVNSLSATAPG